MSKPINFGLLLITLSTLHISYKVIEGVIIPVQANEELIDCLRHKVLKRSNEYRRKYHLQSFSLSEEMNNGAQEWANSLAKSTELKHDPGNADYGANLVKTPALTNLGVRVVDLMYSFIAYINVFYDEGGYNTNRFIGPMTQLLWKSSSQIGVGVSQNDDGDYFVVVYYYPHGNIDNWYTTNLPKFNAYDVMEGQYAQESFNMKQKLSILIYNLRLGVQRLPREVGKYVIPGLLEEYISHTKTRGLDKAESSSIRKQVLDRTNFYRKEHGINPLVLNEQLNNYAQNFANEMALRGGLKSRNTKNRRFGENKYKSSPIIFGNFGEIAVDTWYNQICLLHENMDESEFFGNPDTGCLTQLLWKKSIIAGIGVAVDGIGDYYLLVNYYPTGNVQYEFLDNLPEFKNSEIKAGREANDKLNKLVGGKTKFNEPTWFNMNEPDEINMERDLQHLNNIPLTQGLGP